MPSAHSGCQHISWQLRRRSSPQQATACASACWAGVQCGVQALKQPPVIRIAGRPITTCRRGLVGAALIGTQLQPCGGGHWTHQVLGRFLQGARWQRPCARCTGLVHWLGQGACPCSVLRATRIGTMLGNPGTPGFENFCGWLLHPDSATDASRAAALLQSCC